MKGLWAVILALAAAGAWAADVEKGKATYGARCASCHGKEGKGNPAMAKMFKVDPAALNLTDDATLSQKDGEIAVTLEKGKGKMPAFGGKLKPEELQDVLAFVHALGKGKPAAAAPGSAPAAAGGPADESALYQKNCASCHGKDAKGNAAMAKMFKAEMAALDLTDEGSLGKTDEALSGIIGKGAGKMPGYAKKLGEAEISAVVSYLRSLAPKKEAPAGGAP